MLPYLFAPLPEFLKEFSTFVTSIRGMDLVQTNYDQTMGRVCWCYYYHGVPGVIDNEIMLLAVVVMKLCIDYLRVLKLISGN